MQPTTVGGDWRECGRVRTIRYRVGHGTIPAGALVAKLQIIASPKSTVILTFRDRACATISLQDLQWISHSVLGSKSDLWYFARDVCEDQRVAQLLVWEGIDIWEAWQSNDKSLYRGGRPLDSLQIEAHAGEYEWNRAAELQPLERALLRLRLPRVSSWPIVEKLSDSYNVGDDQLMRFYRILPWSTPIAISYLLTDEDVARTEALTDLATGIAFRLEQIRAVACEVWDGSSIDSLQIEFRIADRALVPAVRTGTLGWPDPRSRSRSELGGCAARRFTAG